jgi:type II secretory pathway pseudopilin PulG
MYPRHQNLPGPREEAGFTLVETLIAVVVLIFGLIAVANLFVLAATSNHVAGQSTGAAAIASQQLDALRAAPFTSLVPPGGAGTAGDLAADVDFYVPPVTVPPTPGCPGGPANHSCLQNIPSFGNVRVRWVVTLRDSNTIGITVEAVPSGTLAGSRAAVQLSTIRTCTAPAPSVGAPPLVSPCPAIP